MSLSMNDLKSKENRILQQTLELEDKNRIVLTRSRMLEIAQERNIFARKMFYTLIALIIFIIVITLVIYTYKSKGTNIRTNIRTNIK
jgi:uncharacterized membrane protein